MTQNLWSRFTTGGILILVGILLLLATTDTISFTSVWQVGPLLFVLLGLWVLVASEFRNLVGPVMVIAIAGAFFARNIGLIEEGILGTWWPLFVVLLGVLVIISRSRRRQRVRLDGQRGAREARVFAVFGTDEQRLQTDVLGGGELVAIFGDARVDLRDVAPPAVPVVLEVISIFGDAEVRVPADWDVTLETLTIFGETIDRRPRGDESDRERTERPEVIVTGIALFGDIEVRD